MGDKKTSAVYNILAFQFKGQGTASQKVKEIKAAGKLDGYSVIGEAVVEQDTNGKVHVHEPGKSGAGAVIGAVGGGLLGLIGGPVGLLAWIVGGALVGGVAGEYMGRLVPKKDLEEFGKHMTPDTSAYLLLIKDIESKQVLESMTGYSANVVTLTVGDELSGEIATYATGDETDDDGNLLVGEDVLPSD
jgi:uncharacterized membrane protein